MEIAVPISTIDVKNISILKNASKPLSREEWGLFCYSIIMNIEIIFLTTSVNN